MLLEKTPIQRHPVNSQFGLSDVVIRILESQLCLLTGIFRSALLWTSVRPDHKHRYVKACSLHEDSLCVNWRNSVNFHVKNLH